jgi:hypothetical protein
MENTYTYTNSISVHEVYGLDNPPLPKGYERTGEFRPPKKGEDYLSPQYGGCSTTASGDFNKEIPRIILRKKKIKRIIYTQVRTGTPQPGEFYQSIFEDGKQMFRCNPADGEYIKQNHHNVPIFKREEEEI